MTRSFVQIALPLLAPVVAWFLWRLAASKGVAPKIVDAPWVRLALWGLVCLIVALIAAGLAREGGEAGSYYPVRYIDGQVVPGEPPRQPAPEP